MKTVIEMARDQGLPETEVAGVFIVNQDDLGRFAELVRADEREKYKWDVHSCGPTCKRYACVAMREAVEAEREACAKVCDDFERAKWESVKDITQNGGRLAFAGPMHCAAAIRARSKT
jgi:hypothetical protein